MSLKIIVIVLLSILITVIFMQNTDEVLFTLLWKEIYVSKLLMMLIVTVLGFLIGVVVARPRKRKEVVIDSGTVAVEENQKYSDEVYLENKKPNQLSEEDREYLD